MENTVDDGAENLVADLRNDDETVLALGRAEPQDFLEMQSGNSLLRNRSTGVSLIRSMRCSPPPPPRTSSSTESCGMAKRSPLAGLLGFAGKT
jgi:hypothetical protein